MLLLDELRRRAAAVWDEIRRPVRPGYVSVRLEVPEFSAMRVVQALNTMAQASTQEIEQLREERLELEEITRRQAARIEALEQTALVGR